MCIRDRYKCILCGKELNTPEYDDRNILDDADYMTVYALQQLYEYEIANREYLKAEGCLKTIDKIRQRNAYNQNGVSKYQYRTSGGSYITPHDYEYSSSSVRLDISTNQITTGGFLLNSLFVSLLKNSADIVLQPFNDLSDIYDDIDVYKRQVHNSANFGVPQQRRQLYIVASLGGRGTGRIFPLACGNAENLKTSVL